jgi:hypothetical protein
MINLKHNIKEEPMEMSQSFKDEAWREVNYTLEKFGEGYITYEQLKSVILNYLGHLTKED